MYYHNKFYGKSQSTIRKFAKKVEKHGKNLVFVNYKKKKVRKLFTIFWRCGIIKETIVGKVYYAVVKTVVSNRERTVVVTYDRT